MDEITLMYEIGEKLPEIGKSIYGQSYLTEIRYEITVKAILRIAWVDDALSVTIRGNSREVK